MTKTTAQYILQSYLPEQPIARQSSSSRVLFNQNDVAN